MAQNEEKKGASAVKPVQEPQVPVQQFNTRDYFTKEINDAVNALSEEQMLKTLVNLEGTPAWIAILKYNQVRLGQSQAAIISGDPVKEPTVMARHQGIMLGLSDLQNAIIILSEERKEAEANKKPGE